MKEFFKIKSRFGKFSNYKISREGEILCWDYKNSGITGIIAQSLHTDGYPMVNLTDDTRIRHTIKVHTLVADTFIPNPNGFSDINHIDENKTNNQVENLEWCTRGYNNEYNGKAIKIGLKLRNNSRSIPIEALNSEGQVLYSFPSIMEASRWLSEHRRADSNIISGIKKHQKRYGYYWRYKES